MTPDPSADDVIGKVLDERYRIVRKLGVGGMGEVYEAQHVYIEKRFAIKLLRREIMSNADAVTRFHQEARAASAIGHENIVEIDDFGRLADGQVFLTMEYLEGQSLADGSREPMPIPRAVDIIKQVCRGLIAAHEKGIIHRDLKPENIFLTRKNGREVVKILDFGIAKMATPSLAGRANLTRTGMIFGTPHYMSPEQAQGGAIDLRSDIYAVGVILYELLVGQVPFRGNSFMAILMRHMTETPVPPREAAPGRGISVELERIVLRAMAKSQAERYESAAALLADLERVGLANTGEVPPVISPSQLSAPPVAPSTASPAGEPKTGRLTEEAIAALPRSRLPLVLGAIVALTAVFVGARVLLGRGDRPGGAGVKQEAKASAPAEALVLVDTEPSGAAIMQAGRFVGETPESVRVPERGTLAIGLHREGYKDAQVTLEPSKRRKVIVTLERESSAVPHAHETMPPPRKIAVPPAPPPASAPPAATVEASPPPARGPAGKTTRRRRTPPTPSHDEPLDPY